MLKTRYLQKSIIEDLKEKMVFIGGPRQVGKTTLAQLIGKTNYRHPFYLNWDNNEDRKQIIKGRFPAETDLVIFDELHKYKQWKNYLKGIFDKYKDFFHILVTGSARLDLYRRGGDSLFGRYHYYRLHPFSVTEVNLRETNPQIFKGLSFAGEDKGVKTAFDNLFKFGGFPEPFAKKNEKTLRRWHNERLEKVVKEDIRDIELVRDISILEVLLNILPNKVGSLFSLNSLREDFQVAHKTIASWVNILERFYYHFRIYPYNVSAIKSLRKEPKLYLWDWSPLETSSIKLENMVASHLLKFTHFLYDVEGYKAEVYFLRDNEGREVDFLITIDKKPWLAIEVKENEQKPSRHLLYFAERLKIPYLYQVVNISKIDYLEDKIRIMSVDKFLSGLV